MKKNIYIKYSNAAQSNSNNMAPYPISSKNSASKLATQIVTEIMQFRRVQTHQDICNPPCSACLAPHIDKVTQAIELQMPINFVLPAFPGKSPNLAKVIGTMPDMAEQRSLLFLDHLNKRIQKHYSPGIQITLCSDGRVFSDTVGIHEKNITSYQSALQEMIKKLSLTSISTFNLDDVYKGMSFTQMRNTLLAQYGVPLTQLKEKVQKGKQCPEYEAIHSLYCGITRFLVEDAMHPSQTKTRASIQKECRVRAYEVIRRSNAWSELIAQHFPEAVRLSIHPQKCGSKKLGIKLVEGESWMTPWHGVAVKTQKGYILLKRAEAEALGAKLVYSTDGIPSHYKLISSQSLDLNGALNGY